MEKSMVQKVTLPPDRILDAVCNYFEVKRSDIRGPRRHKPISYPRAICMFLLRKYTDLSYPNIGRFMGGKDHSTVMVACRKIERQMKDLDHDTMAHVSRLAIELGMHIVVGQLTDKPNFTILREVPRA